MSKADRAYATTEEANHDYYMNAGHTCILPICVIGLGV